MFGFFTYPNKVLNALYRLGWTPAGLPSNSNAYVQMLHGLRHSGVSPEQAAQWIDRALQGDLDAVETIQSKSGLYGLMFFGPIEQLKENPQVFRRRH